jgi:hypothetical protein
MRATQIGLELDRDRVLAIASLLRNTDRTFNTTVRGSSMGAALPDGANVEVQFADPCDLKQGSVVMYIAKDRAVAHRLVHHAWVRGHEYLITRGDASVFCDVPVPASAVVGFLTRVRVGGEWQPIVPAPANSVAHRTASAILMRITMGLLHLHPQLAIHAVRSTFVMRWTLLRVFGRIRQEVLRKNHAVRPKSKVHECRF